MVPRAGRLPLSAQQDAPSPPKKSRHVRLFSLLHLSAPPSQGFVPKALRLGIGQSVGLITFQRLLKAAGVAEYDAEAVDLAAAVVAAGE